VKQFSRRHVFFVVLIAVWLSLAWLALMKW